MRDSSVNKTYRDLDHENAIGCPRPLELLESIVLDNAKDRILKNADVLSVKERDVSQIDCADKSKELFRPVSTNVPESKRTRR